MIRIYNTKDKDYYYLEFNAEAHALTMGWSPDITKAFIFPSKEVAFEAFINIGGDRWKFPDEYKGSVVFEDASNVYVIKRLPITHEDEELVAWLGIKYRDEKPYRDWTNSPSRVLRFESLELAREASKNLDSRFVIEAKQVDPTNKDFVRTPHDEMQIAWIEQSVWLASMEMQAGRIDIGNAMMHEAKTRATNWGWKQYPDLPHKIVDVV